MMEHNRINDDALDPVSGGSCGPRATKNEQLEYEKKQLQQELMNPKTSPRRRAKILIRLAEIEKELAQYDRTN